MIDTEYRKQWRKYWRNLRVSNRVKLDRLLYGTGVFHIDQNGNFHYVDPRDAKVLCDGTLILEPDEAFECPDCEGRGCVECGGNPSQE